MIFVPPPSVSKDTVCIPAYMERPFMAVAAEAEEDRAAGGLCAIINLCAKSVQCESKISSLTFSDIFNQTVGNF